MLSNLFTLNNKNKKALVVLSLILITFLSIFFRFSNLGYSEFQGDEVQAQDHLLGGERFFDYLLSNSKGPGQYIITKIVSEISIFQAIQNEIIFRLPFAIAGILSVLLLTILVHTYYKNWPYTILSAYLISISGFIIAFSRIVQYQSFVILLGLLSIFTAYKALNSNRNFLLIVPGIFAGIGVIFHYDIVSFVIPIVIYILFTNKIKEGLIKSVILGIPIAIISALYYVPLFIFSDSYNKTFNYLLNERITSAFEHNPIWYSIEILSLYESIPYLLLITFGLIFWTLQKAHNTNLIFNKSHI